MSVSVSGDASLVGRNTLPRQPLVLEQLEHFRLEVWTQEWVNLGQIGTQPGHVQGHGRADEHASDDAPVLAAWHETGRQQRRRRPEPGHGVEQPLVQHHAACGERTGLRTCGGVKPAMNLSLFPFFLKHLFWTACEATLTVLGTVTTERHVELETREPLAAPFLVRCATGMQT